MIGKKALPTLRKSWPFIALLLVNNSAKALDPDPYVEKLQSKTYLKLSDGKEIIISQPGSRNEDLVKKRVFMRKGKKILWDRTFNTEDGDFIWQSAHFLPVVPSKFAHDHDLNGKEEIAIAVWHGGQKVDQCDAYIFEVNEDSLDLKKKEVINYDFSRSVYKN